MGKRGIARQIQKLTLYILVFFVKFCKEFCEKTPPKSQDAILAKATPNITKKPFNQKLKGF